MNLEVILFIVFSSIAAITSVMVVTRRNPVFSALFLVLNFGALAGIYLLLFAQFIAVVQVIVYAGAIMVLFLFVIMLLRPAGEKKIFEANKLLKYSAIGIAAVILIQFFYVLIVGTSHLSSIRTKFKNPDIGTVENIGTELFKNYLIPFEAAGFLLLAATIGALILAKKKLD